MLNDIEDLVQKLHECLAMSSQSGELARSIVSDIVQMCGENMNDQSVAFCLSIFFKREKNLLTFLKKAITRDELKICKFELLQFLHRFISAAGKQILPHAADIKDACISLFNSDKYSDVRCATFPIISKWWKNIDEFYFYPLFGTSKLVNNLEILILELSSGSSEIASKLNVNKLADDYFLSLVNQSKLSASVRSNILIILGLICRYHPLEMVNYSQKCLNLFLNTLKTEMKSKFHTPELNVIAGALDGINHYLYNFTQSAEENSEFAWSIFDYARQALLTKAEDVARYAVPRAALNLFGKHAEQFDAFIYDDYKDLFERISQWVQHKNYELKKLAYHTLDSYYKQLAEMLRKKAKEEPEKCKRIFKYFITKFYETLTGDKELKETVIAIKGYGAFAGPCREFMESKDVRRVFTIIIEICERTFFSSADEELSQSVEVLDDKVYQLPSFIESLAYVCNQIDENLPEGSVHLLEKLLVLAVDSYPRLYKRHNQQLSVSIARLLISIQSSKSSLINEFVSRVVYQSLIRIFSYRTSYSIEQEEAAETKSGDEEKKSRFNVSSGDFIMFWSTLLNLTEFKELNAIGVHVNEKRKLTCLIYDEILESLIKIMKKLDLSASKIESLVESEEVSVSSNPVVGLRPSKPRDFEILINLVDFSRELLLQKHFDLFEKWMFKLSKEIIFMSSKNSLISGFYKLNTLCMKISIKIGYFNNLNESFVSNEKEAEKRSELNESMQLDEDDKDDPIRFEKVHCFSLYKKYIKEMFVRKKQFKDELLASCLEFLLSLPKELVELNLAQVFDSLQNALELGINYLPMAENALNSLEYWLSSIKLDQLKPFYSVILAKLDDYLQMSKAGGEDASASQDKTLLLKINYNGKGRKKLPVKLFEKSVDNQSADLYEQIQFRCVKILGQLAGEMSHCLYETCLNEQIITWDTTQHLKFYVPFVDVKPSIYFDRFLPRLVYLSLSSTNRQVKVNACELLHAIVVYTIGKSVSEPVALSSSPSHMSKLYNHIFPALFSLACDVDHFARNLFHPLVMQLIHWFTGNRKYESAETIELLNCIMNGLVEERDAALRDFSAAALKEFLKWSIKHTPLAKQDAEATVNAPVNVKSILKRIFNFLTHPSAAKRLGAALAWNSIYVIFREEQSLVNKHIFELLYYLIESLALAEEDDKMCGTREQVKLALEHVERIMRAKSELLNQKSVDRVKPVGWSEALLEVAVRWLVRQCGRVETECRHKSMELVSKLAPCLTIIKETKDYFTLKLEIESDMYFLSRFEGSAQKRDSLSCFKTLADFGTESFSLNVVKTWLSMLVAPLDCYSWVFGEKLLTPVNLFSNGNSCIWISLSYFIKNVLNYDLPDLARVVYSASKTEIFTPNELEEFRRAKCTALIRLIDFLCAMIGAYPKEALVAIPNEIWCDEFFTCLIAMCLDPESVGFDLTDLDVYCNLPLKTKQFFKLFVNHSPDNVLKRFKSLCIELIEEKKLFDASVRNVLGDETNRSTATTTTTDWLKLSQLINGFEQLSEFGLYKIPTDLNRQIFSHLLDSKPLLGDSQANLTSQDAKRKLLHLSLSINSAANSNFLIEIIDKHLFQPGDESDSFFAFFKNEICLSILKKHETYVKYILHKSNVNFQKSLSLLTSLAEFLASDKNLRKQLGFKVVQTLFKNWSLFSPYWQTNSDMDCKIMLLDLLTKLIQVDSSLFAKEPDSIKSISEMYSTLLTDAKTKLSFKCKLLDLLHFFAETFVPIKTGFSEFVANLPLKSGELTRSDEIYNDYVNAIRKILDSIELTGSFELVNVIVGLVTREIHHVCDEEVNACFTRLIKRLDTTKQARLIRVYWEASTLRTNDTSNDDRKFLLFRKCLYVFLQHCAKLTFLDFLCENVIFLMNVLDVELKELNYELNGMNKKCVLEIFELAFRRLHKDEIFFSSGKLCAAFETAKFGHVKDGKELSKEVLRKCRRYLVEEVKFATNAEKNFSLQRKLHCAAYNCLVALFVRTQTEPKLYLAFLFKDDPAKNEQIFEPLIDKKKKYNFTIELDNFQDRKTKLISLRNDFRETSESAESVNYLGSVQTSINPTVSTNNPGSYLNSQNLYESSLSEELGVFDLAKSHGGTFYNQQQQQQSQSFRISGLYLQGDQVSSSSDQNNASVEIELDELNEHESMSAFVELIQSLVVNKITPIYDQATPAPTDLPPWMSFLHRKISDLQTNENVKLFLIRAVLNTQAVFKPYAKFWYSPLISFLVNSSLMREERMDSFTLDLVVLLLQWNSVAQPQQSEAKLVNRLFECLMKRCYDENRAILKNNLEVFKTIAELWRDLIEVPVSIVYNFVRSGDFKKMVTGIQLLGVALSNGLENYAYPPDLDKVTFFKSLVKCVKESKRVIHAPGAEVLGMVLKSVESKKIQMDSDEFGSLVGFLFENLRELDDAMFITCVHKIQLNYEAIAERFLTKLLFLLPSLYGEFKQMCAESILAVVRSVEQPIFKTKAFQEMLTHRESALQLVCLKMIHAVLDKQSDEDLARLLVGVCNFHSHPNAACRAQMLLILISVYEKYRFNVAVSHESESVCKMRNMTNETLLRSLLDENQGVKLMAQNFWTEKANMPTSTVDRIVLILDGMYSPSTEADYLSYSTNLLLERTSKSPDYNRFIYESPLSECTFREYNLSADWRRRHEMMTPLFVDSQSAETLELNQSQGANLRATQQTLQFQPTQEPNSNMKMSYNWLTQSSVDTFKETFSGGTLTDASQSTLLFNPSKRASKTNRETQIVSAEPSVDIIRLKKRFLKDKSQDTNKFYARKQIEKKSREEEVRRQSKLKKVGHVEKYRQYRIGDFPDVQIKYSEIIAPIQALAQRDSPVAMMLFESLFASILSEVAYLKDEADAKSVLKSIEANLNSMLNKSEAYNPNFVACVLEIGLRHAKSFQLDISAVSTACLNSLQQPLGIVLIEEYLILNEICADEPNAPSSKKPKLSKEIAGVTQVNLLFRAVLLKERQTF